MRFTYLHHSVMPESIDVLVTRMIKPAQMKLFANCFEPKKSSLRRNLFDLFMPRLRWDNLQLFQKQIWAPLLNSWLTVVWSQYHVGIPLLFHYFRSSTALARLNSSGNVIMRCCLTQLLNCDELNRLTPVTITADVTPAWTGFAFKVWPCWPQRHLRDSNYFLWIRGERGKSRFQCILVVVVKRLSTVFWESVGKISDTRFGLSKHFKKHCAWLIVITISCAQIHFETRKQHFKVVSKCGYKAD